MLRAAFVRTVGERDRIYVTRSNGSETSWVFPTYGDALPHDLVHLVVESAFGLTQGFWGRVDGGADPALVNAEANRTGLLLAEALANASWSEDPERVLEQLRQAYSDAELPADALSRERVEEVRSELAALGRRWLELKPKGAIDLSFDP